MDVLLDKLISINDSRPLSPQKKLLNKFGSIKVDDIQEIPSGYEDDPFVGMWVLSNGNLVKVEYTHYKDAESVGTTEDDLLQSGIMALELNMCFISIRGSGPFTTEQKRTLFDLYRKFHPKEFVTDVESTKIKSEEHAREWIGL
jgi:hypothetical protein